MVNAVAAMDHRALESFRARKSVWAVTIPYQIHVGSGAADDLTPGTWQDPGNLCATPSEI